MKLSFLAAASYESSANPRGGTWPRPPADCDRAIASKSLRATIDNARHAEDLGFDWISVSEHHYAPLMLTPNPLVLAGAIAAATRQARIALLGPLLPLANPVRVAEEIAMLDAMSDGRVTVLFLRGLGFEHDTYAPVGAHAREMTQEGIELILKAWTEGQPFAWNGTHYRFANIAVWPRTRQVPHPPMYGSGNSEASALFAARHKFGLAMSFMPVSRLKRMIGLYRAECARAGWTPTDDQILYRGICAYGEDGAPNAFDRAEAAARETGEEAPLVVFGPFFTGGPRTVLKQMEALRDAGVGVVDVDVMGQGHGVNYAEKAVLLDRFAREVMTDVKRW